MFLLILAAAGCGGGKSFPLSPKVETKPLDPIREFLIRQTVGGHVKGFAVPACDPLSTSSGRPGQRVYVYDSSLAAIALHLLGETGLSGKIVSALGERVSKEGALEFSYDLERGFLGNWYVRTGSVAWAGYASLVEGDLSLPKKIFPFLASLQVNEKNGFAKEDPRSGLLLGGIGTFEEESFQKGKVDWVSTRHNVEAYFFLKKYALELEKLGLPETEPKQMMEEIASSLLGKVWVGPKGGFFRGIHPQGKDPGLEVSDQILGALFLLDRGKKEDAVRVLENVRNAFTMKAETLRKDTEDPGRLNCQYESSETLAGLKPYLESEGFQDPPELIWTEGTSLFILAARRAGLDAKVFEDGMERLRRVTASGGVLFSTRSYAQSPYEFHVWESVSASSWAVIVHLDPSLPENQKILF